MPAPTPNKGGFFQGSRQVFRRLPETLRHHFFRPQNLISPEEAAFDSHYDPPFVFGKVRGLVTDHAMKGAVHHLLWLDFANLHPVQNFR